MPTISAVYGTFSAGPEEGEDWWQLGSSFERRTAQSLGGKDSKYDWRPFGWNGLISAFLSARRCRLTCKQTGLAGQVYCDVLGYRN